MAAHTVSTSSSLPCRLMAQVLILLAFHSTSEAFKDVDYTLLSSPSSQISVIRSSNVVSLSRVRRSDNAVQTDTATIPSTSNSSGVTNIPTTKLITTSTPKLTTVHKTTTTIPVTTSAPTTTLLTTTTSPPTLAAETTPTTTTTTLSSTTKGITISPTSTSTVTTPLTKIIEDNHIYYKSKIIQDAINEHWVDLDDSVDAHKVLSNSHRMAATIQMKFKFRFFGHTIINITVATGGFLYMGPFLHQWLTATQYIAPMMANFDTTLGPKSDIKIKDDGKQFVVQWRHVHLKDQNTSIPFNFQAVLDKSGTIKFVYKELPILPERISSEKHPVKIGLSDAYYIDSTSKDGIIRTIYEYHRVTLDMTKIRPNSVVILQPLPTCNLAESCNSCLNQKINFNCSWCDAVKRCSDGIDWHRQDWFVNRCHRISEADMKKCPHKSFPIGAAVGIVVILIVCLALGAGCYYGYSNPSTPLGIWMMEHRPSQMKAKMANMKFWKQSTPAGDKYRIESEA